MLKPQAPSPTPIDSSPLPRYTNALFRAILRLTSRHGLRTLARMNSYLFPRGETVALYPGGCLYVPPDPQLFGFTLGIHEQHISAFLEDILRPGDICVDVGANIGYFASQMAALVGRTGKVIAFEPVAETYSVLVHNAQLANQYAPIVTVLQAAVSSQSGRVRIIRKEFSTDHEVEQLKHDEPSVTDGALSVRLDQELPRLGVNSRIRLMKIDVEGHEVPALRGCEDLLRKRLVDYLVIEVTPGVDLGVIDDMVGANEGVYECWVGGEWRKQSLASLSYRTDIRVAFVPQS
jgi:FkbM family methyltransferase